MYETIEETNIDSLEVVDSNAGATQTETDQQPPPSYDEAIVQNLQNGQARTEGVTGDNQSRLVLQIPARSADQSNDAAHPVSPPPEYHPWMPFLCSGFLQLQNLSRKMQILSLWLADLGSYDPATL